MKFLKKLAAAVVSAAMMLCAAVTADASNVRDWWEDALSGDIDTSAAAVKDGKTYSGTFDQLYDDMQWKVNASAAGNLVLNVECKSPKWYLSVCDKNGNAVKASNLSVSVGSGKYDTKKNIVFTRDSSKKTTKAKATYKLKKGTYYIVFMNYSETGGKLTFTPSLPSSAKIDSYFTVELEEDETLRLSAGEGLTYKSSKTSVADVSDKGVVTANSTGTAIITITNGKKSLKIKIKVV